MILEPVIIEYKRSNGFQSLLNVCDFSVLRVAPIGHVLYFNN